MQMPWFKIVLLAIQMRGHKDPRRELTYVGRFTFQKPTPAPVLNAGFKP